MILILIDKIYNIFIQLMFCKEYKNIIEIKYDITQIR